MVYGSVKRCTLARDHLADAYKDEVMDEKYDNGLLDSLNHAIKYCEDAIRILKARKEK